MPLVGYGALAAMVYALTRSDSAAAGENADTGGAQVAAFEFGEIDYGRDILPVLSNNCFACHGPDEAKRAEDLRLDVREAAIEAGVLVPGDAAASEIVRRICAPSPRQQMPPVDSNRALTDRQIALLTEWIARGAEYGQHWAFVAPVRPAVPAGDAAHPIDRFVDAKLAADGLARSPQADPRTLLRRVALDLTGIPPTPAEVAAFAADPSDAAYTAAVDRLLASPRFGERWATWWLDAARYADSMGYEKDSPRTMWPYRDWVIRALNADVPFDEFTRAQLAGDLIAAEVEDPTALDAEARQQHEDHLLATAFHRNTMTNTEGGTDNEEFRTAAVIDRVNTTMTAFMGLTMACAQCHTHKYDPLLHTEYYGLYAFFNQTADADIDDDSPKRAFGTAAQRARIAGLETEIAALREEIAPLEAQIVTRRGAWIAELQDVPITAPPHVLRGAVGDAVPESEGAVERAGFALQGEEPMAEPGPLGGRARTGGSRALVWQGDDAPAQLRGDQPATVSVWVRPDKDQADGAIVSRMDDKQDHRGWDLLAQGGHVAFHLIDQWPARALKVSTAEPVLRAARWSNVTMTYDGSGKARGVTLYIDGVAVDTKVHNDDLPADADTDCGCALRLGQRTGSNLRLRAWVADLRLFDSALRPDEVGALMITAAKELDALRVAAGGNAEDTAAWLPKDWTAWLDVQLVQSQPEFGGLRAQRGRLTKLEKDLQSTRRQLPQVPVMVALAEQDRRPNHVFVRGSFLAPGEPVEAHTPAVLHPFATESARDRRGLADWLVDPANPLTARVQVNRLWAELFGRGLVSTVEDFGVQGAFPSHPALLDYLAVEFRTQGWSIKTALRAMVTSATYKQSSRTSHELRDADPYNVLLARGPRFRLHAETVRDQALAVSGLLQEQMFGPPVVPHLPPGQIPQAFSNRVLEASAGRDLYRRAVYTQWRRTGHYDSFAVFDAPSREVCVVRRDRSNTPLQALVTLNDPVYVEAAQAFARRLIEAVPAGDAIAARIERAYERALCRPPTESERDVLTDLYRAEYESFATDPERARTFATSIRGALPDGVDPADAAAMTAVCNVVLNLDEFLSRP